MSWLAHSPQIDSGTSSVADLFLSESFISVYLSLPAPLSGTPAPAHGLHTQRLMLPASCLISGGPGC